MVAKQNMYSRHTMEPESQQASGSPLVVRRTDPGFTLPLNGMEDRGLSKYAGNDRTIQAMKISRKM